MKSVILLLIVFGVSEQGKTQSLIGNLNGSLTNGLIGYYPLNGSAQNLFGNDGVNYGAVPVNDRFENPTGAMLFNGTSNYIDCGSLIQGYENATLSVWALVDPACQSEAGIVAKPRFSWGTGLEIRANFGAYPAALGFNNWLDNFVLFESGPVRSNSVWRNYTVTTDGQKAVFYIDGFKVSEEAFTIQNTSSSYSVVIGAGTTGSFSPSNYVFFKGSIDDVLVYDRALTSSEVAQLVPEPSALSLLAVGLGGLAMIRRRRS